MNPGPKGIASIASGSANELPVEPTEAEAQAAERELFNRLLGVRAFPILWDAQEPQGPHSFDPKDRGALISHILRNNPGLTRDEALEVLDLFGGE
jgi:hypothetical protein